MFFFGGENWKKKNGRSPVHLHSGRRGAAVTGSATFCRFLIWASTKGRGRQPTSKLYQHSGRALTCCFRTITPLGPAFHKWRGNKFEIKTKNCWKRQMKLSSAPWLNGKSSRHLTQHRQRPEWNNAPSSLQHLGVGRIPRSGDVSQKAEIGINIWYLVRIQHPLPFALSSNFYDFCVSVQGGGRNRRKTDPLSLPPRFSGLWLKAIAQEEMNAHHWHTKLRLQSLTFFILFF